MADAIALALLKEARARLAAAPVIDDVDRIRLNHRTALPRENAPAVYLRPADDVLGKEHGGCNVEHVVAFVISVFVRDDADEPYDAAFPILMAIVAALNPNGSPAWPYNATLRLRRIEFVDDIADADALRTDMHFEFGYISGLWTLDQ
jgi:hypothetical protein